MLDIKWIRENRPALEKMLKDRRSKLEVAPLYTLDADRRKLLSELEQLQAERNKSADQIGRVKAQKGDVATLLKEVETKKRSEEHTSELQSRFGISNAVF